MKIKFIFVGAVLLTAVFACLPAGRVLAQTGCHTFNTNLGYANSGTAEVGYLHAALDLDLGKNLETGKSFYYPDTGNVYGKGTSLAVVQFQKRYGILQTGYVGNLTRVKLNALYGCRAISSTVNPLLSSPLATSILSTTGIGLSDTQIKQLNNLYKAKLDQQSSLNNLKSQGKNTSSAQASLNNASSLLQSTMASYNVPASFLTELDDINSKSKGWVASFTSKALLSDAEKKKLTGLIINRVTSSASRASAVVEQSAAYPAIPDFFDWRNSSGKDYMTSVKDQSSCGSCWAFADVGALEGEINAYYNNLLNKDFAEQDLVSCSGAGSCNGGYVNGALEYIKKTGVADETCFPYTAGDVKCSNKCSDWQSNVWKITGYIIYPMPMSTDEIKQAIIANGPIVTGMVVYNDFFSYSGGIYSHTSGEVAGNHAIVIVGFGKNDGADYWIVKNSWGTGWGESGYFRIYAGDSSIDSMMEMAIQKPLPPSDVTKICEDVDNDGFCNWGLGTKPKLPIVCPACDNVIEDCDDSNASISQGCGTSTQQTGFLNITSTPSLADIYVQDTTTGLWISRGKTPLIITLNPGSRAVKLIAQDYIDNISSVNVVAGQTTPLNVVMATAPKFTSPLTNDVLRAGDIIEITGNSGSESGFTGYKIDWCSGTYSDKCTWSTQGITLENNGTQVVTGGKLGYWDTSFITKSGFYSLRMISTISGIDYLVYAQTMYFDPTLTAGWPQRIPFFYGPSPFGTSPAGPVALSTTKYYSVTENNSKGGNSLNNSQIKILTGTTKNSSGFYQINLGSSSAGGTNMYFNAGYLEPMVADIIGDAKKETIVYKSEGYHPQLNVFNPDGSLLWKKDFMDHDNQWPINSYVPMPIVGDINNDGKNEIIVYVANFFGSGNNSTLYALNGDGSVLWSAYVQTDWQPMMLMADLDGNGKKEIVIEGNTNVQDPITDIANPKMLVLDNNGNLISSWNLPSKTCSSSLVSGPAVGHFDNSNKLQIVYTTTAPGSGWDPVAQNYVNQSVVYVVNEDGSALPGWPIYLPGWLNSSPVVGDINKDGKDEIVMGLTYSTTGTFPDYRFGGIYAFDRTGKILPGWPAEKGWNFQSTPALGDVDGDGYLEISASKLGYVTYLFRYDGSTMPGWPQYTVWNDYYSSIIGDVNGDGKPDVLTTAGSGFYSGPGGVYGWNKDGTVISGFPKITEVDAQAPAVLSDTNNDGKTELVASSDVDGFFVDGSFVMKGRGSIYTWDTGKTYNEANMPWPMFMHDNQHTGCYDCEKVLPKITVISPNGGESWRIGETHDITWTTSGLSSTANVNIFLVNSSNNRIDIVSSFLASKNKYTWTVPSTLPAGSYKMYISYAYDYAVFDGSDSSFDIAPVACTSFTYSAWKPVPCPPSGIQTRTATGIPTGCTGGNPILSQSCTPAPSITITSPNGGENWKIGETHDITWTSNGVDKVYIIFKNDENGRSCGSTTGISASTGVYSYSLVGNSDCPESTLIGNKMKIFIRSTSIDSTPQDTSDNYFTIYKATTCTPNWSCADWGACVGDQQTRTCTDLNNCGTTTGKPAETRSCTVPTITVTSPNGGENWKIGETHDITWTSKGINNISAELTDSNSNRICYLNDGLSIPASSGKFTFAVNTCRNSSGQTISIPAGTYKVRTISYWPEGGEAGYSDSSDSSFTISVQPTTCSTSNQCVVGGGGKACTTNSDCVTACPTVNCFYDGCPGKHLADANGCINCSTPCPVYHRALTITSPNGGETWKQGETHDITWTATDFSATDNVNITIVPSGGEGTDIAYSVLASSNKYTWTVPSTLPAGSYKFFISYSYDWQINDASDNYFNIAIPTTGYNNVNSQMIASMLDALNKIAQQVRLLTGR